MAISEFDAKVCKVLVNCVDNIQESDDDTCFKTYGDELYIEFRKFLVFDDISLVSPANPASASKKPLSAKEKIIYQQIAKKMGEKTGQIITNIKNSISKSINIGEFIFNDTILDIRAVGFLAICWIHTNCQKSKKAQYGVVVATQRFIKAIRTKDVQSVINSSKKQKVSQTLISDLEFALDKLMVHCSFSGDKLYYVDPNLIIDSPWDKYIPLRKINVFPYQKFLSDLILHINKPPSSELVKDANLLNANVGDCDSPLNAFFVPVCVLTNSGKTTTIVNIASALRKILPDFPPLRIIAVCTIENIRRRWANLLAHCDIPYFCYDEYIDTCFYSQSNPSKEQVFELMRTSIVNIFPPEFALEHLTKLKSAILVYDEPTMYADCKKDNIVAFEKFKCGMAVLKCMPRFTFLFSATLDKTTDDLAKLHKEQFPTSRYIKIYSKDIYGYTNVLGNDGTIVVPHMGCKNKKDVETVVSCIDENPLLGKFYNPGVVMSLYESIKEYSDDIPNVVKIFGDVDNLKPNDVKTLAIKLLKSLCSLKDSIICEICQEEELENSTVDYSLLGTEHAHRHQYMNLIATINPSEFLCGNFRQTYTEIKEHIVSYDKFLEPYDTWLEKRKRLEESFPDKSHVQEAKAKALENYDSYSKPLNFIPPKFQINTADHSTRFTKNQAKRLPITTIYEFGPIPENIDFITHAGAGVFGIKGKQYNDVLMGSKRIKEGLVTSGRLEFLVADTEIAYGTDCPFGGLFIDGTLDMSINTIFQLISRIGRGRKSPYANVYLHQKIVDNIIKFIHGNVKDTEHLLILETLQSLQPIEKFIANAIYKPIVKAKLAVLDASDL